MNRLWIMDRGIPTEAVLEQMRKTGANYPVGTPRGRLTQLEDRLFDQPWKNVQAQIEVKLARDGDDLYVPARSGGRRDKEQAIQRRRLKMLWKRLHHLRHMKNLPRDGLLLKLGAARQAAGNAWNLVDVHQPTTDGRTLILPRYTQPEKDTQLLLHQLDQQLPEQPPPRIEYLKKKCGEDLEAKTQQSEPFQPRIAKNGFEYIQELYRIENDLREQNASPEERLAARQKQSVPILETIHQKLGKARNIYFPKSLMNRAVKYTMEGPPYHTTNKG